MNGPKVTIEDIERVIISEHYFTAADGRAGAIANETYVGREVPKEYDVDLQPLELLTFCILILANGYTVVGKSACASPENFDAQVGREWARVDAVKQIWPLMGFALRTRLQQEKGGCVLI